jgi:RimJ/RimL family protein N-acetyltransferase
MITLRPATPSDRRKIHDWLANSDLTSSMLGAPDFPENPAPTWQEFIDDYLPHFFDGSAPRKGRCYVILDGGQEVGQVNHNDVHDGGITELDIWLASSKFLGKGYGTKALKLICELLVKEQLCRVFYIAPSMRNQRAIRSYGKAGFSITRDRPPWFVPDYDDAVLMKLETAFPTA